MINCLSELAMIQGEGIISNSCNYCKTTVEKTRFFRIYRKHSKKVKLGWLKLTFLYFKEICL